MCVSIKWRAVKLWVEIKQSLRDLGTSYSRLGPVVGSPHSHRMPAGVEEGCLLFFKLKGKKKGDVRDL